MQLTHLVSAVAAHVPLPAIPHGEEGLLESIWLLLTSVITVPLVCKLPGGSPVLGFLVRFQAAIRPCRFLPCRRGEALGPVPGWWNVTGGFCSPACVLSQGAGRSWGLPSA